MLYVGFVVSLAIIGAFCWAVLANRYDPRTNMHRWNWLPGRIPSELAAHIPRRRDRLNLVIAGTVWGLIIWVLVTATLAALCRLGIIAL
jgi:hypothetical protein